MALPFSIILDMAPSTIVFFAIIKTTILFLTTIALIILLPTLILDLSFFKISSFLPSSQFANKGGYSHNAKNMTIKLSTILVKSIMTTYKIIFVKQPILPILVS